MSLVALKFPEGKHLAWALEKNRQEKEMVERLALKNEKRRSAPVARTKTDSTILHVKVSKFTRNKVRELAKKRGLSVTAFVGELLEQELEKENAFDEYEILMMGVAGKEWFQNLNFDFEVSLDDRKGGCNGP